MPVERKWQRPKISNSYSAVILIKVKFVTKKIKFGDGGNDFTGMYFEKWNFFKKSRS